MRKFLMTAMAATAAMTVATAANATVTINITQTGSIITAVGTGTLNLTGMTRTASSVAAPAGLQPNRAALFSGAASAGRYAVWSGFTATPTGFGGGTAITAPLIAGGSFFGITTDLAGASALALSDCFTSGDSVRFLEAWADQTFASLGVSGGQYTYVLPNDKIVINVAQAVPEPASWAMMIVGMGLVGYALRRQRREAAAIA